MLALKELGPQKCVVIDYDVCTDCRLCIDRFGCPAMFIEDDKVAIDSTLCNGCGVCIQKAVCKKEAIKFEGE
jgi:indolepyruvate ferredoxin oxidoreductase alpha subunit